MDHGGGQLFFVPNLMPRLLHQHGNYRDISSRLSFGSSKYWHSTDYYRDDGHRRLAPVGSFAANAWDLHDMHGNTWEWVLDKSSEYGKTPVIDPLEREGDSNFILRGGSWTTGSLACASAVRVGKHATYSSVTVGFRVVLGPDVRKEQPAQ